MISQAQYEALVGAVVAIPTPEELFDFQVDTLRAKEVISNPYELRGLRGMLPRSGLFIVVPQTSLSLASLVELVEIDGKKGKIYLNENKVTDVVETPKGHYLMIEVEDGRRMLNVSPDDAQKTFARENRSGYTAKEGIFHCLCFPKVLKHHFLDLSGSRYDLKHVPGLVVDGGRPGLSSYWSNSAYPGWGSASCGSRMGI